MPTRALVLLGVLPLLAAAQAATRPADPPKEKPPAFAPGTVEHGRHIYQTDHCGDCHSLTLDQDAADTLDGASGRIRAGHPLQGAPYRGTWWGGRITTDAGDASEFCLSSFVDPNRGGFGAPERRGLVLFMQSFGSDVGVSPLVLLRRDEGDVDLGKGDAARGRPLYERACASCHPGGEPAAVALMGDLSPTQASGVIRKGAGRMAFFQVDRLSAGQVADIATYLEALRDASKK